MATPRTQSMSDKIDQVKALNIPGIRINHGDNSVLIFDRPNTRKVTRQLKALGFHNHRLIGVPQKPGNYSSWEVPKHERVI